MAACTPVDLGGGTLESPCLNWFGCGAYDHQRLRRVLQTERNYLVSALTTYNQVVAQGKVKWTPATSLAYDLANGSSYDLLQKYPQSVPWSEVLDLLAYYHNTCTAFAQMAAQCHAATCDVLSALEAAGEVLPQKPIPPPAPQAWGDQLLDFTIKVAKSVGIVAVVGAAFFAAVTFAKRKASS